MAIQSRSRENMELWLWSHFPLTYDFCRSSKARSKVYMQWVCYMLNENIEHSTLSYLFSFHKWLSNYKHDSRNVLRVFELKCLIFSWCYSECVHPWQAEKLLDHGEIQTCDLRKFNVSLASWISKRGGGEGVIRWKYSPPCSMVLMVIKYFN